MTIAEYAERILFAETLEDKLEILPLSELDEDGVASLPGRILEPGRPENLVMREKGETGKTPLPSRPQLVNEESRGVLFHFFGNHELMAAELMALALLKFPDAPRAFRRGLLQTLREEQRHTLWYVRRMEECGVEFGSHPLSRFFWDAVAPMETPLDYVTRLSLTFEQANLDYARHFSGLMREAGDEKSGKLMDQIYRDEISHVGYGLTWFRKWKKEGQSDWDAYRDSLVFPLSPSRAKGNGAIFNEAGRREAGLEEGFVRELAIFERSKGRTPDVYWFNADAEAVMARGLDGGDYEPKRSVSAFVRDLELLATFLARRDDVVLVRDLPRREYLERLRRLDFDLPEYEKVASESKLDPGSLTATRRLRDLRPWAWEPRAASLLEPMREKLPDSAETPSWTPGIRTLFSKPEHVRRWPWWSGKEGLGPRSFVMAESDEASVLCAQIRKDWAPDALTSREVPIVWKPAYAAAGRGFWLMEPAGLDARGFDGGPNKVRSSPEPGVAEPWVERVFDFSVQFDFRRGKLRRRGFVRQVIGAGGRYAGTVWTPKFCRGLDSDLARFLMREALPAYDEGAEFPESLREWLHAAGYSGPVGVDAFVYRDLSGNLAHRVIGEINPRYSMGRLALELSRRISAGHSLRITIERKREGEIGESGIERDRHGKLCGGRIALNDPPVADGWVVWMTVAREVADFES